MKQLQRVAFWLCCLALGATVACETDDEQRDLTPEEKAQCLAAVGGEYAGKVIYAAPNVSNPTDKTDTLALQWNIPNDSTLIFPHFPTRALAQNVKDAELKAALLAAVPPTLTCRIGFIRVSPVLFLINPIAPSFQLHYGGMEHTVQVAFYVNNSYSFGSYDTAQKILRMQLIEGAIYVDGVLTDQLSEPLALVFVATRA